MPDFHLLQAVKFDRYRIKPYAAFAFMETPVRSFHANIDRIGSLLNLPPFLILSSQIWQKLDAELRLKLQPDRPPLEALLRPLPPELQVKHHNLKVKWLSEIQAKESEEETQAKISQAFADFEFFVGNSVSGDGTPSGGAAATNALFTSLIVQAWTAYESLAVDLFAAIMNKRSTLLPKFIDAKVYGKVDLSRASASCYDPNTQMGDFLRDEGKLRLDRVFRVNDYYTAIFEKDWTPLSDMRYHNDLLALELILNLVVHAAGVVDQIFLGRVKQCGITGFSFPEKSRPLELNGELCRRLISAASVAGTDLIGFVDRWFVRHP